MRNKRDIVPLRRRRGLSPFEDVFNSYVDNFFNYVDDFFNTDFLTDFDTGIRADIKETDKEYIIEADMPGFDKEDIEIELIDDRLTIKAKKDERVDEESENYIRRERRYDQAARCFIVQGIEHEDVVAEYKNGVLEITLPKSKENRRRGRKIDIK